MTREQPMQERTCGICFEVVEGQLFTDCCDQPICSMCFSAHMGRAATAACPFCRCPDYSAHSSEGVNVGKALSGDWDVHITETSPVNSCSHNVTLSIHGESGSYEECSSYVGGGGWSDVAVGHTASGKSFTARQKILSLPEWLQHSSAVLLGRCRVEGRLHGRDRASYSAVVRFSDKRGDTLELRHEARMTRKRSTRAWTF